MKRLILIFLSVPLLGVAAPLKIVTTTTDLKVLVESVGKSRVEVTAIAKGFQDPHEIEAKPSFMVLLRKADQVFAQGLDLERAWLEPLVNGARNPKIKMGVLSVLELGPLLEPIEIAKGEVSRSQGDVHPGGNPHFQLDPIRMGKAAELIAQRLSQLDPAGSSIYLSQGAALKKELEQRVRGWQRRLNATGIKEIVTYHKTLAYFCARFEIRCEVQLEPKPGIPPTADHLIKVIDIIKQRNIKTVFIENYFDAAIGEKIKAQIPGLKIFKVPVAVAGEDGINNSFHLIERLVKAIEGQSNVNP